LKKHLWLFFNKALKAFYDLLKSFLNITYKHQPQKSETIQINCQNISNIIVIWQILRNASGWWLHNINIVILNYNYSTKLNYGKISLNISLICGFLITLSFKLKTISIRLLLMLSNRTWSFLMFKNLTKSFHLHPSFHIHYRISAGTGNNNF
jgi:hypothetical protein